VRPVGQAEARLKEAAKLGFATAIVPSRRGAKQSQDRRNESGGIALREIAHLRQLVALFEDTAPKPARVLGPAHS
jgi:DNA repair protein RadA/Sms